jgi:hypothetical protein
MALFFLFDNSATSKRSSIFAAAAFVLVTCLVVSPWVVRPSRLTGTFCMVTTGGPWNLWFGNNPWLQDYMTGKIDVDQIKAHLNSVVLPDQHSQKEWDSAYLHGLRQFVLSQPLTEAHLFVFKTMQLWRIPGITSTATHASVKPLHWAILLVGFLSYVPLMICGVIDTAFLMWKSRVREISIYLFWILVIYASYIWFPAVNRFRFAGAIDNLMIISCVVPISILLLEHADLAQGVDQRLVPISETSS